MRQRLRSVAIAVFSAAAACATFGQDPQPATIPARASAVVDAEPTQIDWQRSLADARALARATGRPLLLAVNMDGESASDRIVHENYRDPKFVAATRQCVCLVASVFRHAPRDHDDAGRRILCPRLGGVTCGEHIALEQQLWDAHLSDGERVAPRHALIAPSGAKVWDLSLAFDLGDITREFLGALGEQPAATGTDPSDEAAQQRIGAAARLRLETQLARMAHGDVAGRCAILDTIAAAGDAGSLDALLLIAADLVDQPAAVTERFVAAVRARGLTTEITNALIGRLRAGRGVPHALGPDGSERLLPVLASLDGRSPNTRSFLLACRAIDAYGEAARRALEVAFGSEVAASLEAELAAGGGPLPLRRFLDDANAVTREAGAGRLPSGAAIEDPLAPAEELEAELLRLDAELATGDAGPSARHRHGKASLDLARVRLAAGDGSVQLLFEDAAKQLRLATDAAPEHAEWWIARARAAYFLQRFDEQVTAGRRAFELATGAEARVADADVHDPLALEALRWIGDGLARSLESRSGDEPALELRGIQAGLRALGTICVRAEADATDWLSFASFCGALGLWREQLAIAQTGTRRLPAANELWQSVSATLWSLGRVDCVAILAEDVVQANPESADARWFLGYAELLSAEDLRRRALSTTANAAYERAARAFETAQRLDPTYAENCRYYLALSWLGRGMAAVQTGDRRISADCLVRAIEASNRIQDARDGLGNDVPDLIDKTLEWRASGASDVDVDMWSRAIERAAPAEPFWHVAIADALLREALRADGRNPDRRLRATVDAGGQPIEMMLGRPTESGDRYLAASLTAVRRALPNVTSEPDRSVCAQSFVVFAERELERERELGVADALLQAASLLELEPDLRATASADELRAFAARLRTLLGPARPRLREGR